MKYGTAFLELKSDNHNTSYEQNDLDAWIFTNSSKINLHYNFSRFDQISIQLKSFHEKSVENKDNTRDYLEAKYLNHIEIFL